MIYFETSYVVRWIAGFKLKAGNFKKLDSDKWFDDIMNASFAAITSEARDRSQKFSEMSLGFQKWVIKTSVLDDDYKVWSLPVINNRN